MPLLQEVGSKLGGILSELDKHKQRLEAVERAVMEGASKVIFALPVRQIPACRKPSISVQPAWQ